MTTAVAILAVLATGLAVAVLVMLRACRRAVRVARASGESHDRVAEDAARTRDHVTRLLRAGALHVREQFSRGQAELLVPRVVELVQEDLARLFTTREGGAASRHGHARLPSRDMTRRLVVNACTKGPRSLHQEEVR